MTLQWVLGALGGRLAVITVVMLALGWLIMAPLSVRRHAAEEPFRVDSLAFDTAAQILVHEDPADLYDLALQRRIQEARTGHAGEGMVAYFHPPIVAAAFTPLTPLSARAAYVVTAAMLGAVMAATFALMLRLLDGVPRAARWAAAMAAAGSTTVASALISGQLTPLLLLLAVSAVLLMRAGRPGAAGVALGLLCIKPHFALAALVVLALTRQRRAAAFACATMAACILASIALVGPAGARGYVSLLRESFADPAAVFIDVRSEQNLRGLVATVFGIYGGPALDLAGNAISVAVLAAVAVALVRSPYAGQQRVLHAAALGAVLVCAAAPHVQYYDLALLVLPALFIVRRAAEAPAIVRPRFYGLLVLLVLWLEVAGVLAGAKLSLSVVPLLAFAVLLCAWPTVERWLADTAPSEHAAGDADALLRAAA